VKSYRLYLEHVQLHDDEPVLSLTRAWTLVRFFDSGMLQMTACCRCGGTFCRARPRSAARLRLRAVPAAFARR
jgi:Flagellar transcriptional activator (FlhC).